SSLEFRRGRFGAAVATQERAIRILRKREEPTHAILSTANLQLAQMLASRGDSGRAAALLAEAMAATEERLKKRPANRTERGMLAFALVESGRLAAAAGDHRTASSRFARASELLAPFAADSRVLDEARVYAEALVQLGRVDEARPIVERMLSTGWRDPRFLSLLRDHGL